MAIRIEVRGEDGNGLERALRKLKKRCDKENLIREIKRASFYEKPSERKRRARRKAEKRALKVKEEGVFK